MTRETVGKVSSDLLPQQVDNTHSADEQMREQLQDYDKNLFECALKFKQQINEGYDHFFLVVLTKKERLMQNVIRNYFAARYSCPTPEYDQTVYIYNTKEDSIYFLWTIPAKDICQYLYENRMRVDPSERELVEFVMHFYDGTLLDLSKKLNNEKEDSPLLEEN